MVDFVCALKPAMPIAVLSAIRENSSYSISVKGGRFLEAVSRADTIVFEGEGYNILEGEEECFHALPAQHSHLYLCIAGKLAAVICIYDSLRAEVGMNE